MVGLLTVLRSCIAGVTDTLMVSDVPCCYVREIVVSVQE
ncbi:hypothetical protein SPHINGOT1_80081 [Sphingomonas sp. T1]|nr:hypothetical protein SPHINGOT1_80081 [Sphingomonas sp. T1]